MFRTQPEVQQAMGILERQICHTNVRAAELFITLDQGLQFGLLSGRFNGASHHRIVRRITKCGYDEIDMRWKPYGEPG